MRGTIVAFLIVAGALAWRAAPAIAADPEPRAILAPSGVLRAALYPGTPTSILPDPNQTVRAASVTISARSSRERLGVPYEPVVFSKNADVLAAIKDGTVDVAFTKARRRRGPGTWISVRPSWKSNSAISSRRDRRWLTPTEVDAPGLRVGVTAGSSSEATLTRDFKKAEVVRATNFDAGIEMMSAGKLDAYATNKASLFEMAEKLPGSKVLDGRWGVERLAVAIPKGRDQGMAFVRQFTHDVKSEGLVGAAIARAGLRGAVTAAE